RGLGDREHRQRAGNPHRLTALEAQQRAAQREHRTLHAVDLTDATHSRPAHVDGRELFGRNFAGVARLEADAAAEQARAVEADLHGAEYPRSGPALPDLVEQLAHRGDALREVAADQVLI